MLQLNAILNLGADARVKTINEKQYISFRGASTEKVNGQDQVTWISCLASHNPNLLPFLKKGQQVFVSGCMKAGIYQSQNSFGIDISVFASTLQLCGGKREETQQQPAPSLSNGTTGTTAAPQPGSNGLSTGSTVIYPDRNPAPFPPPVDENGNPKFEDGLPF